jgi:PKD repeat protein
MTGAPSFSSHRAARPALASVIMLAALASACGGGGGSRARTTLDPVSAFTATVVGIDVHLSWKNPSSRALAGVRIQRRGDAFPSSPSDGTTVFDGLAESCTDAARPAGTFYYAAFAHDQVPTYSTAATATAVVAPSGSAGPWGPVGQVSAAWYRGALWALASRGDASDAPGHVWSSTNGASWSTVTSSAPWGAYASPGVAVFADKLWVLGGVGQWDAATRVGRSVWWSTDGASWTMATDSAPLDGTVVAVHDGRLWIVSGTDHAVYASGDGATWTTVGGPVPWSTAHAAWSWKGRLWVAAVPTSGDGSVDYLWSSPDGSAWTIASGTYLPSAVAAGTYRGQAVLLPGRASPSSSLLFSGDGARWQHPAQPMAWTPRSDEAVVFTGDRVWVLGGQTGGATLTDVWSFGALLGCEGSGTGNDRPSVTLRADPAAGDAPHRVLLVADAADPNCDPLSYSWDFGDGTRSTGPSTVEHVYAAEGPYTAQVTVSDGQLTATGTVTIEVAPRPWATASIGAAGGTVSVGAASVAVPALDGLPESPFTLTRLPSHAAGAAAMLPPDRFVLIGDAYRLETPVSSGPPLIATVSWSSADIPTGFDPANLVVVFRSVDRVERKPSLGPTDGPTLGATYVALPATVDPSSHTASFELHGRDEFQLAACARPLPVFSAAAPPAALSLAVGSPSALTATGGDRVKIVFDVSPDDVELFRAAALSGFFAADGYAQDQGFVVVPEMITIVVTDLPSWGAVNPDFRWRIELDRTMAAPDQISKVTAHEYFHTVQAMASNKVSNQIAAKDDWWWEGTACWFSDQVPELDPIPGGYFATTFDRLALPLDAWKQPGEYPDYQTVAFWKWLEQRNPGAMMRIMNRRLMAKRELVVGLTVWFKDTQDAALQLTYVGPDLYDPNAGTLLDYLDFSQAVLHRKDFDVGETGNDPGEARDLWGSLPQLDRPNKVLALFIPDLGTSEEDKAEVTYDLQPHLSMFARTHRTTETGTLHFMFPQTDPDQHYRALVRVYDATDPSTVFAEARSDDLSLSPALLDLGTFDATMEALVIVADVEWADPSMVESPPGSGTWIPAPPRTGTYQVWIQTQCPGSTQCGSICTDLQADDENCGACGHACIPGLQYCEGGECLTACPDGSGQCNGACPDYQTDPNNCGACGNVCGAGVPCQNYACLTCQAGQRVCAGSCTDVLYDPDNCGACGASCGGGERCSAGACEPDPCPTPRPSVWVSTSEELNNALAAAKAGSVIGLRGGASYAISATYLYPLSASLVSDARTARLGVSCISPSDVTLKNLELETGSCEFNVYARGSSTLCNVSMRVVGGQAGVYVAPGATLRLQDSIIRGPGLPLPLDDGIGVEADNSSFAVRIDNSVVTGLVYGLRQWLPPSSYPQPSLQVDCAGFSYNVANAVTDQYSTSTVTELCPNNLRCADDAACQALPPPTNCTCGPLR